MSIRDDVLRLNKALDEALRGIGIVASWREEARKSLGDLEDETDFVVDEDLWEEIEEYAAALTKKIKSMRKGKL